MYIEPIVKKVFIAAILMIIFVVSIYVYQFGVIFPSKTTYGDLKALREAYGVIGDFFGGVLNPILTFCGFGFLIYTINQNSKMLNQNEHMLELANEQLEMTRKEMELSRAEMEGSKQALEMQAETLEIQRFESTFFNLLGLYESCRIEVRQPILGPGQYVQGKDAFRALFVSWDDKLKTSYAQNKPRVLSSECKNLDGMKAAYRIFYEGQAGDELAQYFRVIYQVLKIVDKAEGVVDKAFYIGLLRAQLSRYELIMLFYNCLSDYSTEKMRFLVKKYELLKHLELGKLPLEHVEFFEKFSPIFSPNNFME